MSAAMFATDEQARKKKGVFESPRAEKIPEAMRYAEEKIAETEAALQDKKI